MKKIFEVLKDNPLFSGIGYSDFDKMFRCLEGREQHYKKDDIILLSGDTVSFVGLIVSGSVKIIKEDADGHVTLLAEFTPPALFGEAFACAGIDHSPVTVLAAEKSVIFFINYKKIVSSCASVCDYHTQLLQNMLKILAKKNLMLNEKIAVLSKRSIRERLLLFFDMQRGAAKKFTLSYNREEMAHYLCVDRSALSNELGKMRDEGLIRFNKNHFEIL